VSLTIEGLSFGYRKNRPIVEGLDLLIPEGRVTALLGSNGAGKTTLLRLLLGLLRPWKGTISLGGLDLTKLSVAQRSRLAAYVPQLSDPAFPSPVSEIVLAARFSTLGLGRSPTSKDWDEITEALELMGITELADRPFLDLSGGEKRKALIARALAQKAQLMVLDEPTANLDPAAQADCLNTLKRLAERSGRTIIMASHFPDHALWSSDLAVLLKDGKVLASGPVQQTINPDNLSALYGRPFTVAQTERLPDGRTIRICVPLLGKSA
jgi:ABC-type cobalamin/Fe3+-siderophores transport system ATPase subunit